MKINRLVITEKKNSWAYILKIILLWYIIIINLKNSPLNLEHKLIE